MVRTLIFVFILATLSVVVRIWLMRQDLAGRALVSLGLLSIAMYTFAFALYGACHGEVNFLASPFACTRPHPVAINLDAYRIGRAR